MTNTTLSRNAEFFGTPLQIIEHKGQSWLTAEQIGRCLGYPDSNARKGVMKIYERHSDEFGPNDQGVVNLTTASGAQDMRVFSREGCVLLSMFANTPRAKDFRAWAKRVLAAEPPQAATLSAQERTDAHLAQISRHMAELVAVSAQQARKMDLTGRYISLLEMNQRGSRRVTPELGQEVLALHAQGMPQADIARLLRTSATTVNRLIKGTYPATQAMPGGAAALSVEAVLEARIAAEAAALTEGSPS